MSSNRIKKTPLNRTELRRNRVLKIYRFGLPAGRFCNRCVLKGFDCICISDGACYECVRSGQERDCDCEGMSRVDRLLSEQEAAFSKALEESASAQEAVAAANEKAAAVIADAQRAQKKAASAAAKAARLAKVVKGLRSKSKAELDEIMKELEKLGDEDVEDPVAGAKEGGGNESNSVGSSMDFAISPSSWESLMAFSNEVGLGFVDGTSSTGDRSGGV